VASANHQYSYEELLYVRKTVSRSRRRIRPPASALAVCGAPFGARLPLRRPRADALPGRAWLDSGARSALHLNVRARNEPPHSPSGVCGPVILVSQIRSKFVKKNLQKY